MALTDPFVHWRRLLPVLNEAQLRWYAATKALELGRGGIERVHEVTGLSRPTLRKGIAEVSGQAPLSLEDGIRRPGGGRHRLEKDDASLVRDLVKLLEATTAGDPMTALRWTSKSTRALAQELVNGGHTVGERTVARLLHDLHYSQQGNRKSKEGVSPPERDEQFHYINAQVKKFAADGDPVLSIDCKKKERVGEFKNAGKTWRKQGDPREVNVYDFPRLALGQAIPYGVYDVQHNDGLVNVGISHETAEFAVESIRRWWRSVGRQRYAGSKKLLLCADGGGSNSSRTRAWKLFLQELANETGLAITVCHYPPGTSKWNKIEHRMFSFISMNWSGEPLVSFEAVVNLIGGTTTKGGLHIKAGLDKHIYRTGREISKAEMAAVRLTRHRKLPQWNYTVMPNLSSPTTIDKTS